MNTDNKLSSRRSKIRKYLVAGAEILFIVVVVMGISAFQARHMLPTNRHPAPALEATTLLGSEYKLADRSDRPVLIYFFAPWCPYCSASADNIERLRRLRDEDRLEILIVALDWKDRKEVEQYVEEHEITLPVLLGDSTIASDWKVQGFPTYYVIDSRQRIVRRDVGYSTQFGLWWRSWVSE